MSPRFTREDCLYRAQTCVIAAEAYMLSAIRSHGRTARSSLALHQAHLDQAAAWTRLAEAIPT